MPRNNVWPGTGLFILLTIGAGLAWGLACGFCLALWQETFSTRPRVVQEALVVDAGGEPLIQSYNYTAGYAFARTSYRSLAGDTLPEDAAPLELSPANLPAPPAPGSPLGSYDWRARLAWGNDARKTLSTWYLIRDRTSNGLCYFEGFDHATKLRIGYLGRGGFRDRFPDREDQFRVGELALPWQHRGRLIGLSGHRGSGYRVYADDTAVPQWCAYLLDETAMIEVDFRSRKVRTLMDAADIVSMGTATAATNIDVKAPPREGSLPRKLVIRKANSLTVLNPATDEQSDYTLPPALRAANETLVVYTIGRDALLAYATDQGWRRNGLFELVKFNAAGEVLETMTAEVAGYRPQSTHDEAIPVAVVAPVPLLIAAALSLAPLDQVHYGRADSYLSAVGQMAHDMWPAILIVVVVGAVAAGLVWRWQLGYRRRYTAAWCGAVFLLGLPGLLGYWFHHRRPPMEACGACGQTVPRNRDACADCGEAFAAPALLGTELLA